MIADDTSFRFGGIERLYGRRATTALRESHIAVAGLGLGRRG
jgi:tRNA A37 threonylcarbamoyladenosine dehydratase